MVYVVREENNQIVIDNWEKANSYSTVNQALVLWKTFSPSTGMDMIVAMYSHCGYLYACKELPVGQTDNSSDQN